MPRTARACMPVTMRRSTWSGESSAAFSAAFHACSASGAYFTSPKRSSQARDRCEPGARHRSMNSSVALAPPRYSAMTGPSASEPTMIAAAPSPPCDSSALVGQAVAHVGGDHHHAAVAVERGAQRTDTRSQGAAEVERAHLRVEPERGVDRRGVVLVEVGRVGGREPQRAERGALGRRAPGQAAGLDAPSWWCPRRRRRPTGSPCRRPSRRSWRSRRGRGGGTGRSPRR